MKKYVLPVAVALTLASMQSFAVWAAPDNGSLTKEEIKAREITQAMIEEKLSKDTVVAEELQLDLETVLRLALENNRDIKIAEDTYEKAKFAVNSASAAKNPKITYGYSATHADFSGTEGSRVDSSNSFGHNLGVSMPLYTGGKTEGAINVARYNREIAREALKVTKETVKLSAASAYYNFILANDKAGIADDSVKNLQEHLKNVNAQYTVGIVAKSDVLASKVALSKSETTSITSKNAADLAEANLNNILGLPVSTTLKVAENDMGYEAYSITLEEAEFYALQLRSELVQAALAVKGAEENVKIAKAGHKPTVAANAGSKWSSDNKWSGTDNNNWSVGASVSFDIWDGGSTEAGISSAKAALDSAKESNSKAIDSVLLEVRQAYLNMKAAEQTITTTKVAVEQAEENFSIASVRYRAGVGTNLDALDAELKLNTAKINYVEALYNYNIAVVALEKAMGITIEKDSATTLAKTRAEFEK